MRAANASSARWSRASSTTRWTSRSFRRPARRLSLSTDLAGLGGNSKFIKPTVGGRVLLQGKRRGCRSACAGRWNTSRTSPGFSRLPIFQKIFLGGDYTIRGFDLRSIGPRDLTTGLVLGGNKSLLFNLEQIITIAGPVRLILFYDAGQVRDTGESVCLEGGREGDRCRGSIPQAGRPAMRSTTLHAGRRRDQPAGTRPSASRARSKRRLARKSAFSCLC